MSNWGCFPSLQLNEQQQVVSSRRQSPTTDVGPSLRAADVGLRLLTSGRHQQDDASFISPAVRRAQQITALPSSSPAAFIEQQRLFLEAK